MTYEDLSKQLNTSVQTVQNLVQVLSAAFADMEGGEPFTPIHPYNDTEHIVGIWYHDSISENVYERTINISDCTKDYTNPTDLGINPKTVISTNISGIFTSEGEDFLITGERLNLTNTTLSNNFTLYTKKETTLKCYWTGTGTIKELYITIRYTKESSEQ